jgi:hypothetical protein
VNYDPRADASQQFFKVVQNKVHWAAHGQTAAEVIARRADAAKPNMGLTSWAGGRPRRTDAGVAKNYLTHAGGISHDVAIAKAQAACCRQTQNETAEANGIDADSPCHNSHSRTAAKQWCTAPRGKSWTKSPRWTPKARRCRGR